MRSRKPIRQRVRPSAQQVDRQREHQANERTFLAWLRTSIALIGFGFAIARFGLFLRQLRATLTQQTMQPESVHPFFNSETLGVSLVGFGILTIAFAAWQYHQVFWQIERGNYRPNRSMIWVVTAIVMLLGIFSIPLIVNQPPVLPSPPQSIP